MFLKSFIFYHFFSDAYVGFILSVLIFMLASVQIK